MAWRIHEHVMRAVIDNRIRGTVTGAIWLAGRADPIRLYLQGNAWSDLAGSLVRIENASFRPGLLDGLATEQRGVCGDVTTTRRGRMPAATPAVWLRNHQQLPVPQVWGTGIHVEWFSERNGRVIIDLMGCWTCISERTWQPTPDEQVEPSWCNLQAVDRFLRARTSSDRPNNRCEKLNG
jgi:hypothetical protein